MKKNVGIKVISMACGVKPHSIRTWETRYQVFSPIRTSSGQRGYSEDDLARASCIGKLIKQGHSISKIARLSIGELRGLLAQLNLHVSEVKTLIDLSVEKLLFHLANYNIDGVAAEIEHLRVSCGAKEFVFRVVLPVMEEIGVKVSEGKYTVTQEHIISTIVREQLGRLSLPNIGEGHRRVALATPDGNMHELSIIIADILCRSNRVPTSYFGASHPAECLAEAVNALKIPTIIMGVVSSDSWDYEKSIMGYLKNIDKYLTTSVNIVLGGGWVLDFPQFKNIKKIDVIENFEIFNEGLMDYSLAV